MSSPPVPRRLARAWSWTWPKLLALGLVLACWQAVYLLRWRPPYVLPPPSEVFSTLLDMATTARFWRAVGTTLQRAVLGFSLAVLIGSLIGVAVSRIRPLRLAVGSLITGLQTMPSIAWFPLAIILFGLDEAAILFVVVLGAAPSVANGVIASIDQVPPSYVRLGRTLGLSRAAQYADIVLPAALPGYLAGLTQGWAFAWRSLMAGELLVIIASQPSLGGLLEFSRQFSRVPELIATMITILVIGMAADAVFASTTRTVLRRRGLAPQG